MADRRVMGALVPVALTVVLFGAAASQASSAGLRPCGASSSQEAGTVWATPDVSCIVAHSMDVPARTCALVGPGAACTVLGFSCVAAIAHPEGSITHCVRGSSSVVIAVGTTFKPQSATLDPCRLRYPSGVQNTVGSQTLFDRQASLYQVCEGFGAPDISGFKLTPSMQCAIIAAAATYGGPVVNAGVSKGCAAGSIVVAFRSGSWLGATRTAVSGSVCGYFSDIFAGGVGVFVAGATSEAGPGAVAIGVTSYKALAAGLHLVCGGVFTGVPTQIGQKLEARHETAVAIDVIRHGKCLAENHGGFGIQWSATACASRSEPTAEIHVWGDNGQPYVQPTKIALNGWDFTNIKWSSWSGTATGTATFCQDGKCATGTLMLAYKRHAHCGDGPGLWAYSLMKFDAPGAHLLRELEWNKC